MCIQSTIGTVEYALHKYTVQSSLITKLNIIQKFSVYVTLQCDREEVKKIKLSVILGVQVNFNTASAHTHSTAY